MTTPSLGVALLLQAPAGGSNPLGMYAFEFVAIIAIFYFIMIRPQQQQRKQRESMLAALKRGDEIVTLGGLVGEVVHIKEQGTNRGDDRVTIKSGDTRVVVERGRIDRVVSATGAASDTKADKADKADKAAN